MGILWGPVLGLLLGASAAIEPAALPLFEGLGPGLPPGWRELSLKGHTGYSARAEAGRWMIHAQSRGGASALLWEHPLELRPGATLSWTWRVSRLPAGEFDEREKSGDDRAASLFVVIHRSWLPWRWKGIIYTWSAKLPVGTVIRSPYARGLKIVVVESGTARLGQWVAESRDLEADARMLWDGDSPTEAQGIALLTDSDDTDSEAMADYGELELGGAGPGE